MSAGAEKNARWVLAWFERRGNVPGATEAERLAVNFFESELIDSLGVIELIADIEDHYRLRFTAEHFQDRRFATIRGLGEIIADVAGNGTGRA